MGHLDDDIEKPDLPKRTGARGTPTSGTSHGRGRAGTALHPSTVLFLAANPLEVPHLQLDDECRSIEEKLRSGRFHHHVRFRSRWAARRDDLLQALNEDNPTVLHFSGHGAGDQGLCLQAEDGSVVNLSSVELARIMRSAGNGVLVVVLNACYTEVQARALMSYVPCVIGMSGSIGDGSAIAYAVSFYRALAFGRSVANAHAQGIAALPLSEDREFTRDATTVDGLDITLPGMAPRLFARSEVDAEEIYLVQAQYVCTRRTIIIEATLEEFHPEVLARITEELHQLTGDFSIRVIGVEAGSVRLIVELSQESARLLDDLEATGRLRQLGGRDVTAVLSAPSGRGMLPTARGAEVPAHRASADAIEDSAGREIVVPPATTLVVPPAPLPLTPGRPGSPRKPILDEEWPLIIAALLGDDLRMRQEARALLWTEVQEYVLHRAQLPLPQVVDDKDVRLDIALAVLRKLERNNYAALCEWRVRHASGRNASRWWTFVSVITKSATIDWVRTSRLNLASRGAPLVWAQVEPTDPSAFAEFLIPSSSPPEPALEPLWLANALSSELASIMDLSPRLYESALRFAAERRHAQGVGADPPFLARAASVATETMTALALEPGHNANLAVSCALLHDTIEDTGATHAELVDRFGVPIADGVRALSRRPTLPKREQFADSLRRIQVQPTEVWMVKLAERITSLASPPRTWSRESFERDRQEAIIVADALGQASAELDGRLRDCIASYPRSL